VIRSRTGSVLPGVAPSNVYTSADGVEVIIAANADAVYGRLCDAMGRPDLREDPRFRDHMGRGQHMAELDAEIDAWSGTLPAADLIAVLAAHEVPAGRMYTAPDMLADPHYLARGMVQRVRTAAGTTVPMPGVVPKFSRTPGGIRSGGPRLGEHTSEILAELVHASAAEIERLRGKGILG
jgi:succinyl-CoA---D-citramalate CoA-transferase